MDFKITEPGGSPPWKTIYKRILLKCAAAAGKTAVAFEKEGDLYRSATDILRTYFDHAEQLAEETGSILEVEGQEVLSQCPKDVEAFKSIVPLIVRGSIGCFNKFFKQDADVLSLDPDCQSGAVEVITKEWDQERVVTLLEKWKKVARALVERQVSRVNLSLEHKADAPKNKAVESSPPEPPPKQERTLEDLKNDLKMIGLAQASFEYNIPRSTLSAAAKRNTGQAGFLASIKIGHLRFFYKDDLRKLARSREAYRRKPRS